MRSGRGGAGTRDRSGTTRASRGSGRSRTTRSSPPGARWSRSGRTGSPRNLPRRSRRIAGAFCPKRSRYPPAPDAGRRWLPTARSHSFRDRSLDAPPLRPGRSGSAGPAGCGSTARGFCRGWTSRYAVEPLPAPARGRGPARSRRGGGGDDLPHLPPALRGLPATLRVNYPR